MDNSIIEEHIVTDSAGILWGQDITKILAAYNKIGQSPEGLISPDNIRDLHVSIKGKYQFRENLQSPTTSSLPSLGFAEKLWDLCQNYMLDAQPNFEIELPGIGQLTAELCSDNGEAKQVDYSMDILSEVLTRTPFNVALHSANLPRLAEPTLKALAQLPKDQRERIHINFYAREGKNPEENLRGIVSIARELGLTDEDISRFRIGWEHSGTAWVNSCKSGENGYTKPLTTLSQNLSKIYEIARDNNFSRISMPETSGTLSPWQAYFYTLANLNLMAGLGYTPDELELHFHNDSDMAEDNYRAALKAISDFNETRQKADPTNSIKQVNALVDFSFNGIGERNGIHDVSQELADILYLDFSALDHFRQLETKAFGIDTEYSQERALLTTTAGTHADLYADRILENVQVIEPNSSWEELTDLLNKDSDLRQYAMVCLIKAMHGSYLLSNGNNSEPEIKIYHGSGPKAYQLKCLLDGEHIPNIEDARKVVLELKANAIQSAYSSFVQ